MSERRKKALVIYMAALFGIAFLIVSVSLCVQLKKNTLNATSAEKVIALQNEIQTLKDQKKELENSIQYLQENLSEVLEGVEYLEGQSHEANARINGQDRLLEINSILIAYQQAVIDGDEAQIKLQLEELKKAAPDAQPLDNRLYQIIKTIINDQESETDE